jgi:TRAP-type C4-dicarboxylate transport system permease small subunit
MNAALDFIFDRIATFLAAATFTVALAVMAAQVVFRYALSDSLMWSEEVARYALVWSSMVGAAVAYRHGSHVAVTDFVVRLPRAFQALAVRMVHLLILAFSVILAWQSWTLTMRSFARHEVTAALQVDIAWALLALPAGAALMVVAAIEAMWQGRELSSGVTAV